MLAGHYSTPTRVDQMGSWQTFVGREHCRHVSQNATLLGSCGHDVLRHHARHQALNPPTIPAVVPHRQLSH